LIFQAVVPRRDRKEQKTSWFTAGKEMLNAIILFTRAAALESQSTLRLKGIDWHPFDVTLLGQQNCFSLAIRSASSNSPSAGSITVRRGVVLFSAGFTSVSITSGCAAPCQDIL